jgi:hypothetical protein
MVLEAFILEKGLLTEREYAQVKAAIFAVFDPIPFVEKDYAPIFGLLIHDKKMNMVRCNLRCSTESAK